MSRFQSCSAGRHASTHSLTQHGCGKGPGRRRHNMLPQRQGGLHMGLQRRLVGVVRRYSTHRHKSGAVVPAGGDQMLGVDGERLRVDRRGDRSEWTPAMLRVDDVQ